MTALAKKMKTRWISRSRQDKEAGRFTIFFVIFIVFTLLAPVIIPNTYIYAVPGGVPSNLPGGAVEYPPEEMEWYTSYSSWIQADESAQEELYQGTTGVGFNDSTGFEGINTDIDNLMKPIYWVVDLVSSVFMFIGYLFDAILSNGWGVLSEVNLSTDAVIYGRLKEGVNTNWVYFELVPNNIYGILGSMLYRFLTNVCYSVFVILFLFLLFKQATGGGDSKQKAEFKDMLEYSALMFLFFYLFPHIVDICIYLKDWLLLGTYNLFGKPDDEGIGGLARTWANLWFNGASEDSEGIFGAWYAILYMGTVCAGLFFVIDYVKTAAKQTVLFGLSPVFFVLSIKNRRLLSNLIVEIIPNIFIPLIDAILMLLPIGVARIAMAIGATTAAGIDNSLALIILILIWSIIPMRREILRLFGASGALGGSRGFGGIMAAAMMAMRMFGGRGGSSLSSGAGAGMGTAADNADLGKMYGEMSEALHSSDAGASMIRNSGIGGMERIAEEVGGVVSEQAENARELGSMDVDGIVNEAGAVGAGAGVDNLDFDNTDIGSEAGMPVFSNSTGMDDVGNITPPADYGDDLINARGANLDQLAQMENADAELTRSAASLQREIGTLESANARDSQLLGSYDSISSRIKEIDGAGTVTSEMAAERQALVGQRTAIESQFAQSRTAMGEQVPYLKSSGGHISEDIRSGIAERSKLIDVKQGELGRVNTKLAQNRQSIHSAREAENLYAKSSKHTGASGETYNSAEYKRAMQLRDIKMRYANYRNFDSGHFKDVLTPEEKMRFYTERAGRQRIERNTRVAGTVVGVAAGVGAGAVLAVGSMYGGPGTMTTAGTIGGIGIGSGVSGALSGVGRFGATHVPAGDVPGMPYSGAKSASSNKPKIDNSGADVKASKRKHVRDQNNGIKTVEAAEKGKK